MTNLKKQIMRRVYYAYTLRLALHPFTTHGVLLAGCFFLMTYFVSFTHVVNNLLNIKVGQLGQYVATALADTELWTLLLLGLIVFIGLSLRYRLSLPSTSEQWAV